MEALEERRARNEEIRLQREEMRLERDMRRREEREQRLREQEALRERKEREAMLSQSTYQASPVFYSVLGEDDQSTQTKKRKKRRKLNTDLFGDTKESSRNQGTASGAYPDPGGFCDSEKR